MRLVSHFPSGTEEEKLHGTLRSMCMNTIAQNATATVVNSKVQATLACMFRLGSDVAVMEHLTQFTLDPSLADAAEQERMATRAQNLCRDRNYDSVSCDDTTFVDQALRMDIDLRNLTAAQGRELHNLGYAAGCVPDSECWFAEYGGRWCQSPTYGTMPVGSTNNVWLNTC